MVRDRLNDGVRIAQLLASEVDADGGRLDALAVTDADSDVEPTVDGALAFAVRVASGTVEREDGADEQGDGADEREDGADENSGVDDDAAEEPPLAETYVHPDRAHVEFRDGHSAVAEAAEAAGLRVRPTATRPPKTVVFVEDGAQVKRARAAFAAALEAVRAERGERGDRAADGDGRAADGDGRADG